MDQSKIGAFLKSLRKEKGFTQKQLAEQMSVSSRTVSRWETGSNMPDISLLIELADFYDVDIREIIDGERKNDMIAQEAKDVLEQVADYTDAEKKKLLKGIMINSVGTLICLILLSIPRRVSLGAENAFFDFLLHLAGAAALILTASTIRDILKINGSMGRKAGRKVRKILCIGGVVAGILCAAIVIAALIR